jgi:N-dimethylarginine dimethylaminohydrolase
MAIHEEPRAAAEGQYEEHLRMLRERAWQLDDVPFYEPGQPCDFTRLGGMEYLDIYPEVWGRPCGENGIGRLREVAISKISDAELAAYDERYPFHEDLDWLESHGLQRADIGRMQEEQAQYAELLSDQGVSVHWIDWGEAPMSAFGPMQAMWAPSDLWVIRGGSVIQKTGWHPFSFGRSEFLARWAQHHLGIPILYTVVGKGVQEPATTMWFADDVWVTGISAAYNAEGNRQLEPVVRRSCPDVDLEVHTIYLSTDRFVDRQTGLGGHLTNVICPLDIDKVLVYSAGVDAGTHQWLRAKGYTVVEVPDREEQIRYTPTNTIPLEPGVVFMVKEARRSVAAVRKAGVEVIEVPNEEFSRIGGALHCRTLRVLRDPGPLKNA